MLGWRSAAFGGLSIRTTSQYGCGSLQFGYYLRNGYSARSTDTVQIVRIQYI